MDKSTEKEKRYNEGVWCYDIEALYLEAREKKWWLTCDEKKSVPVHGLSKSYFEIVS